MLSKNLWLYFSILGFNNFWFVTSNWVNYWLKFMSLPDVGIIDSLAFFIGILIEVPSGVFSDRFGRKISLIFANLFQFLGTFWITIADNRYEIAFGFIVFQIGVSLFSGSIEALGYESCDSELQYEKVAQRSVIWSNICYLLALVIGGYLYNLKPDLTNFLWSVNYLVSILFCMFLEESAVKDASSIKSFLNKKFNFRDFLDFDFSFALLLLSLSSISFIFDYGFLKISIMEEFSSIQDNYWYLFSITCVVMLINFIHFKLFPPKDYRILKSLSILFIVSLLLPFLGKNWFIITFSFLTYLTIFLPQLSLIYINSKVSNDQRASAISIFSFFWKLPYVVLAPTLGYSIQNIGSSFSLASLGLLLPVFLVSGHIFRKIYYNYVVIWGRSSVVE